MTSARDGLASGVGVRELAGVGVRVGKGPWASAGRVAADSKIWCAKSTPRLLPLKDAVICLTSPDREASICRALPENRRLPPGPSENRRAACSMTSTLAVRRLSSRWQARLPKAKRRTARSVPTTAETSTSVGLSMLSPPSDPGDSGARPSVTTGALTDDAVYVSPSTVTLSSVLAISSLTCRTTAMVTF